MMSSQDQKWLNKALADCFSGQTKMPRHEENLTGFKILVTKLIQQLEHKIEQLQKRCQEQPASPELKQELDIIARQLFFLRRFCEGRKEGGKR